MDWTGGTRRRFTAGKTSAARQKQKSHFAKARAAAAAAASIHPQTTSRRHSSRSHKSDVVHSDRALRTTQQRSPSIINLLEENWNSITPRREPHAHVISKNRPRLIQDTIPSVSLKDASTEEERLLAIRCDLLRRSDWLGLAVTRPLKMKFPISNDNCRIGKRRKVTCSDHPNANKARSCTRIPLFEHLLPQPEILMSGALPIEDVRIKIGTDALASATQVSQGLLPSERSFRSISSGPLLEESMRFDEEDDDFDLFQQFDAEKIQQSAVNLPSVLTAERQDETPSLDRIQQSDNLELIQDPSFSHSNQILNPHLWDVAVVSHTEQPEMLYVADDFVPRNSIIPTQKSDNIDTDEEKWRNLMGIKKCDRDHERVAASPATSHNESSTDVSRHSFALMEMSRDDYSLHVNFDQTDAQMRNSSDADGEIDENLARSSNSLPLITAEHPAPSPKTLLKAINKLEQDSDEAMWRAFVLGSRKVSEESQSMMLLDDEEKSPTRPPYSPSLAISGLGSSIYTMVGDQTHAPSEMTDLRSMY
ncbi:Hypothetical protein R9X50_00547300 [Acrodontium crateriforme]|uniref:Uncharacterized protein n=1 Tax=Acrodontium crateriforme TaxID=150365 RepID=A0AAQ3RD84_9PEZI|nr:Hypothetical protein R9X50_00547300 [Acrodontium crateriforme]